MDLLERSQAMVETGTVLPASETHGREQSQPCGVRAPNRAGSWSERLLFRALAEIAEGQLELNYRGTTEHFGQAAPDGLRAAIEVRDPRFFQAAVLGGSLGAAEAYLDGWWDSPDLVSVVRLLARNRNALGRLDGSLSRIVTFPFRLLHRMRANTRRGSRRNIRAHYDLGNELFAEFLDPSLTYSSAYFEKTDLSLEEAQRAKLERIAQKLALQPNDHVLEIGTGWGALALHFAGHYGCRVTTITISRNQFETASQRIKQAGLQDRVQVLLQDYRDVRGCYSKVVSVEMIEAVGLERLEGFFDRIADCLASNGLFCLQAITIAERFFEAASRSVDFIQRYIFPGGAIPSVTRLVEAASRRGRLVPLGLEELGLDYAETLKRWRERFLERRDQILRLGLGERFVRMWNYYFAYCEGGFRERSLGDVQLLFGGTQFRDPVWRASTGKASE